MVRAGGGSIALSGFAGVTLGPCRGGASGTAELRRDCDDDVSAWVIVIDLLDEFDR